MWGIPADRVMVVMRDDVRLEVSRDAYFSSDRVAVKATMRVGFAFPHPAAGEVVGQSLARDMARRLDAAFLGNMAAPAPAGLGSLPTTGAGAVSTVDAGGA